MSEGYFANDKLLDYEDEDASLCASDERDLMQFDGELDESPDKVSKF